MHVQKSIRNCPHCKDSIITPDGKWSFCIDCPHFDIRHIVDEENDQTRGNDNAHIAFSEAGKIIVSSLTDIITDQRLHIQTLNKELAESVFTKQ